MRCAINLFVFTTAIIFALKSEGQTRNYLVWSDFGQGAARIVWESELAAEATQQKQGTVGKGQLILNTLDHTYEDTSKEGHFLVDARIENDGAIKIILSRNGNAHSQHVWKKLPSKDPWEKSTPMIDDWAEDSTFQHYSSFSDWSMWYGSIRIYGDNKTAATESSVILMRPLSPEKCEELYLSRTFDSLKEEEEWETDYRVVPVMTGRLIVSATDEKELFSFVRANGGKVVLSGWSERIFEILCHPTDVAKMATLLKDLPFVTKVCVPFLDGLGDAGPEEAAIAFAREKLQPEWEKQLSGLATSLFSNVTKSSSTQIQVSPLRFRGHSFACRYEIRGKANALSKANYNEWERASVKLQVSFPPTTDETTPLFLDIELSGVQHCKWPKEDPPEDHWKDLDASSRRKMILRSVVDPILKALDGKEL